LVLQYSQRVLQTKRSRLYRHIQQLTVGHPLNKPQNVLVKSNEHAHFETDKDMEKLLFNGLILVLPILLVRYTLLSFVSKEALKRAAFFPPTRGIEKTAYRVHLLALFSALVILLFSKIKLQGLPAYLGFGLLSAGLVLYIVSVIHFARPNDAGLNITGIYRFSRNPMYVAFFLYFLGCCLLTHSWYLLVALILFQISVHFLIIFEERWCKNRFGEPYTSYMKNVRRYI
jgi:protein-S-isoprenylcysteine O-methyltransferase Ste14